MPRKTTNKTDIVEEKVVKKVAKRETKKTVTKKEPAKKVASKSTEAKATKKATKASEPKTTKKSTSSKAKTTAKKATKTVKKTTKSTTKKSTSKSTTKKSTSRAKKITANSNLTRKIEILEYYDLPYRYNQTVIKILAQTPHSIFIYWDISDADRHAMEQKYGNRFFYETKPILLVHNQTLNYSFEIEIDDFTNSWYLHTPTSDCVFNIELGRKKISNCNDINIDTDDHVLHIASSNTIESPNDHVLKDTLNKPVYFKNIKTNELEERKVSNLNAIRSEEHTSELQSH